MEFIAINGPRFGMECMEGNLHEEYVGPYSS